MRSAVVAWLGSPAGCGLLAAASLRNPRPVAILQLHAPVTPEGCWALHDKALPRYAVRARSVRPALVLLVVASARAAGDVPRAARRHTASRVAGLLAVRPSHSLARHDTAAARAALTRIPGGDDQDQAPSRAAASIRLMSGQPHQPPRSAAPAAP